MNTSTHTKEPIFTKSFNLNFAINFFVYLCMYLLIVVIASYSKTEFHTSDSLAGLVVGLFIIGSLIGRFITGKYVNQFGPKKILIFGLICIIVTQLLYFILGSVWFLMIVRLLNGLVTAIATTATGTIAAYVTPPTRKSEGISLFSLSLVLGTAIGLFFGMLLMTSFSINVLFIICVILGVLSGLLGLFIKIDFKTTENELHSTSKKGFSFNHFIAKEAVPVAIVMLLIGVTYAAILTYLQAFAIERYLVTAASYFFIFYTIASLVTRPIAGRLIDDKNENVIMYPAFVFLIISFALLMFSFNGWILLIALGIGYGNLSSSMQAIAIKVSPSTKYGLATSTYFIGLDIGIGFDPSILGLFTHMITYSQLYGIMAILGLITLVIYLFIHGRKVKHQTF